MSKNTNLSFLTDYITADITNGRIGINNASPAYAFDVTGIARTSTSTYLATASGKLGIGTTTPTDKLEVQDGDLSTYHNANASTAGYGINFYTNGGGSKNSLAYIVLSQVGTARSGDLLFLTSNSGAPAERMRITSAGNVGIGTSSPDQLLCLRKTSAGAETIALALQNVAGTAGTTVSMVFCPHESSATPEPLAKIAAIRMVAVNAPTDLAFYTYGTGGLTEKMRVLSTGDLVVGGTTSPLSEAGRGCISINGSANSILTYTVGGTIHGYLYHGGSNGNMYLNNSKNNATTYVISYTNGVYLATNATSWTSNSDIRLKNIISPIDSAVDKLTTLNPVIFSWKSDDTNKENIGLIAQDVKEVFPQAIDTNEDGFLGVRYVELVPVLVKAIQELSAEITLLKNK